MLTHQPFHRYLPAMILVLVLSGTALAQFDSIPPAITNKSGGFTAPEEKTVTEYVKHWVDQLVAAESPEKIAQAREKLYEPARKPGVTLQFIQLYRDVVYRAAPACLKSENPLVRQNILVAVANIPGGVPRLSVLAMGDKRDAVRYWAAKSAANATANEGLIPDDRVQISIMQAVSKAMQTEKSGPVAEQMYLAMSGLKLPQARSQLLKGLEARAMVYATEGLSMQMRGELKALKRVSKDLVAQAAGGAANNDEVITLTVVHAKYLQVIKMAVAKGLDDDLKPIAFEVVELNEQMLNWAVKQFDPNSPSGPTLYQPLQGGDDLTFQLHVVDWVGEKGNPKLLTKSRIAIPLDRLLLIVPEKPAEQPKQP